MNSFMKNGLLLGVFYFLIIASAAVLLVNCGDNDEENPPSVPTGVTAAAGDGQATITWNAVGGATSYNIYWATAPGVTKATGTKIPNAASPYIHTGLTNGTTYHYVVTAVNNFGESTESSQVSATPATSAQIVSCSSVTPSQNISIAGVTAGFSPSSITVSTGAVIRWTNNDISMPHTVTSGTVTGGVDSPDGKFDSGDLNFGGTVCIRFQVPGSYPYFCDIHPATMQGSVNVQ